MATLLEILDYDFMRHALLAALLVGLAAPWSASSSSSVGWR